MNKEFKLLDCFDDNIDNLNLTKSYIYVLELIENRYYIGRTANILRRIEEHFTNNGSIYTKAFKPIKIIEICEEITIQDEKEKTLEYMSKYGWEKVRGYSWCSLKLLGPPKLSKKRKIPNIFRIREQEIEFSNEDNQIKNLYDIENKDIIEIATLMNKTPGSIAYRLEKIGIINRRQLARGYYAYINSEMYREICRNSNKKKVNVKEVKIEDIKKDIEELRTDVLNIKERIRQLFLTSN